MTYSPPGVPAIVQKAGLPPDTVRAVVPKTEEFKARGIDRLPSIFHKVPSDITNCGPRPVAAIVTGFAIATAALNGIAGNTTRPVWTPLFRSTILIDSPPAF